MIALQLDHIIDDVDLGDSFCIGFNVTQVTYVAVGITGTTMWLIGWIEMPPPWIYRFSYPRDHHSHARESHVFPALNL